MLALIQALDEEEDGSGRGAASGAVQVPPGPEHQLLTVAVAMQAMRDLQLEEGLPTLRRKVFEWVDSAWTSLKPESGPESTVGLGVARDPMLNSRHLNYARELLDKGALWARSRPRDVVAVGGSPSEVVSSGDYTLLTQSTTRRRKKAGGGPAGHRKKCSECGQLGHNKRFHAKTPQKRGRPSAPASEDPPRRRRRS